MRRDLPLGAVIAAQAVGDLSAARRAALAATIAAILGVLALYASTAAGMVEIWRRSDTFAHGFLVVPIAVWLIWRDRELLRGIEVRPWWPAQALALAAGAAWLLGELTQVNALRQFALATLVIVAVPAVAGMAIARRIAFPLGFLLFAVPFGEFLLPPLMEATATFTVQALRATGIPVYREGLQFVIPSGAWSIVEACSGVRYLIASTMVGTLFAYLTYRSTRRRLIFIGVSLLVPIVANWVRAYLIVLLGHVSNNRLAAGVDHLIYGWLFFGFVMLLMFWIGARWREDDLPATAAIESAPASEAIVHDAPSARFWWAAAALVTIAALPVLAARGVAPASQPAPVRLGLPAAANGWHEAATAPTTWRPIYIAPSGERFDAFAKGDASVGTYLAFYRAQTEKHKLVSSTNMLVRSEDQTWAVTSTAALPVRIGAVPVTVRAVTVRGPGGSRLRIWQWYWVDGDLTSSEIEAKLDTLRSQLSGRGDGSAVVILVAPVAAEGSEADADQVLSDFAQSMGPGLAQVLNAARAQP